MRKENPRIRRQGKENKGYWFTILPENCGLPFSDGSFVVSKEPISDSSHVLRSSGGSHKR